MTFGLTRFDSDDMLSQYANSANTAGLAQAMSGEFAASPSFDLSAADDPAYSAAYAGTGLSKARDVNVGALSYNQALNFAPKGGEMITKQQALADFTVGGPGLATLLFAAIGGYYGYRRSGMTSGALVGILAALGIQRALQIVVVSTEK